MKLTKTIASLCFVFSLCVAAAQPLSYPQRVEIISSGMRPQIADLWQIYGKMEALSGAMQKRAARNGGENTAADKDEWDKLKASLATNLQQLRNSTKRLRSISPVPRSLKKIDARFVTASFELEDGFDSLVAWTNTPSPEMNLQLGREIRKGVVTWKSAQIALNRATDPAVTAKVYAEN